MITMVRLPLTPSSPKDSLRRFKPLGIMLTLLSLVIADNSAVSYQIGTADAKFTVSLGEELCPTINEVS